MAQINDAEIQSERYSSNLSNKISKILKNQLDFIEEYQEENVEKDRDIWLTGEDQNNGKEFQDSKRGFNLSLCDIDKENIKEEGDGSQSKKSLVNIQKCMKELNLLKEKDLEIDNRFKKINKSKSEFM